MKKKLLGGIAVFAMATVVAINVNLVIPKQNNLSSLVLANLEALGRNESGGPVGANKYVVFRGTCYDKNGQETGSFVSCYVNGYVDCTPKKCP